MQNRISPLPIVRYVAAVERVQEDGSMLCDIPVSGQCRSERGAWRAVKRVRRQYPDAYVLMRRRVL
jgi:hypothetical protein